MGNFAENLNLGNRVRPPVDFHYKMPYTLIKLNVGFREHKLC